MLNRRKKTTPPVTPAARAYLATSDLTDFRRKTTYGSLDLVGASLELEEAVNGSDLFELRRIQQRVTIGFEVTENWAADRAVVAVPVNVMVRRKHVEVIYANRRARFEPYWGRVDTPVAPDEIEARAERDRFRKFNRNARDPLISALHAATHRPPWNARALFIAVTETLIGAFTTEDAAVAGTSDYTQVVELAGNGSQQLSSGTLVRGYFQSGWGFAAGRGKSHPDHPDNR